MEVPHDCTPLLAVPFSHSTSRSRERERQEEIFPAGVRFESDHRSRGRGPGRGRTGRPPHGQRHRARQCGEGSHGMGTLTTCYGRAGIGSGDLGPHRIRQDDAAYVSRVARSTTAPESRSPRTRVFASGRSKAIRRSTILAWGRQTIRPRVVRASATSIGPSEDMFEVYRGGMESPLDVSARLALHRQGLSARARGVRRRRIPQSDRRMQKNRNRPRNPERAAPTLLILDWNFGEARTASPHCGPRRFRVYSPRPMPTFYDRFVECAERWPDNVALELQRHDHLESCTYAELRRMAESVGRWITETDFPRGSRLAILADNHPAMGRRLSGNHRLRLRRGSPRYRPARRPSHQAAERQRRRSRFLRRETYSGRAPRSHRTEIRPHPHGSRPHDGSFHRGSLAGQSARDLRRRPGQFQSRRIEGRRSRFPALYLRHDRRSKRRDADPRQFSGRSRCGIRLGRPWSFGRAAGRAAACFMFWRRWRTCCCRWSRARESCIWKLSIPPNCCGL